MGLPASNIIVGECTGFPDVCKTPVGPAVVPTPYPNIALTNTPVLPTAAPNVMLEGGNAMLETSMIMLSNGDEAGVLMGVKSEMIMGPCEYTQGSTTVIVAGRPLAHLTSVVGHNGGVNANDPVGTQTVPSAPTILVSP